MSVMGRCFFIPYRFCLVLLYRDSQTATFLIPERFSAAVRFRRREQNSIFTTMTQDQINFLSKLEKHLAANDFEIVQSISGTVASAEAELFGNVPIQCRFKWRQPEADHSVTLSIILDGAMWQVGFPIGLLMDYDGDSRDACVHAIRRMMGTIADEIIHQFFKNILR